MPENSQSVHGAGRGGELTFHVGLLGGETSVWSLNDQWLQFGTCAWSVMRSDEKSAIGR